ncbi:hypothetical protein GCM10011374_03360 [Kocuria dechangensis]|uniref:Uncharacterized protein n=1 Tax=Kocuria dechangensis TaxID=1176249 RepID=A0A917GG22_9MICC|nr:hypothetical protein GCM10011374_03360 [Kocuria dechangensis]
MSAHNLTPVLRRGLPWHQRIARAVTFGTLSAAVTLGPFSLGALILNSLSM